MERDEEDATEEEKVAVSYITAHRECSDAEREDIPWLVREYRKAMLQEIGEEVRKNCHEGGRDGQAERKREREAETETGALEEEWRFRQVRKLRWEQLDYFLYSECLLRTTYI